MAYTREKEIKDILTIGKIHRFEEEAQQFVMDGESVEQFKQFVNYELQRKHHQICPPSPLIGLTSKEARQFSFSKLIRANLDPSPINLENAAFELEIGRAAEKRYGVAAQGIMVPYDVLVVKRDLNTSSDASLVGTDHLAPSFIDVLRHQTIISAAGAMTLEGLIGNVTIPKKATAANVYWIAEGDAPTESEATFASVSLSPKTCGTFTDVTRTMILQSTPAIEQLIINDLAGSVAVAIDRAALHGAGANNEPLGLDGISGIGSVVAGNPDGGAIDWGKIVDLESAVADGNADSGRLAYITNPKVRGKLKKTLITDTYGEAMVWDNRGGKRPLNGYPAFVSNGVRSDYEKGSSGATLSGIFFGNFGDLIVGKWAGLDILVDPYSQSSTGTVRIRVFQSIDIAVRHVESFAECLDVVTT